MKKRINDYRGPRKKNYLVNRGRGRGQTMELCKGVKRGWPLSTPVSGEGDGERFSEHFNGFRGRGEQYIDQGWKGIVPGCPLLQGRGGGQHFQWFRPLYTAHTQRQTVLPPGLEVKLQTHTRRNERVMRQAPISPFSLARCNSKLKFGNFAFTLFQLGKDTFIITVIVYQLTKPCENRVKFFVMDTRSI